MPCEVRGEELARFEAGEVDEERAARLAAHLDACAECRRRVAALRRLAAVNDSFQHVVAEPVGDLLPFGRRLHLGHGGHAIVAVLLHFHHRQSVTDDRVLQHRLQLGRLARVKCRCGSEKPSHEREQNGGKRSGA